jgi:hypothetical protein
MEITRAPTRKEFNTCQSFNVPEKLDAPKYTERR